MKGSDLLEMGVLASALFAGAAGIAHAGSYRVTNLPTLGQGTPGTINYRT